MGRLENKIAIITGGASGLGKEFCFAYAKEGAKVVIADFKYDSDEAKQAAKEIEEKGGLALQIDISDEADTKRMAEKTIKKYGRIDILVNNAAMLRGITRKGILDTPVNEWDQLMAVNLRGLFLVCRAAIPQMIKQNRGKIIVIASQTAFTGSKGMIHYVTSKGGCISFARCLAAELGQYNICVNTIAPGFTDSPAARSVIDDIAKYDVSRTPLGRLGKPEDLAGAAIFFASDDSNFITGQVLLVDGGRYMH